MNSDAANDHRQFYKGGIQAIYKRIGSYLPDHYPLGDNADQTLDFSDLRQSTYGTVMFTTDFGCSACKLEPVIAFAERYPFFNYRLFLHNGDETLERMKELRSLGMPIEVCHLGDIAPILSSLAPAAFAINSQLQIVSCGIYRDLDDLEQIAYPFIRVSKKSVPI
ncbi:hypothetical protein ACFPVX_02725 [Cohnella faecalis]|uniref:Thioredoxin family protein n=1 Tax=Cohnella faecalis TaxID=2315694 RepID=A0A398D165_9BACL|nr:hypothetical protein [Cohnella faecalis]RIE05231.1 hypothetical protein D3H35_01540 [Cohnella faecalis]